MKPPGRLLVLRFSAVGDVVLTSPALEALATHWPDTHIVVATLERHAELLQHNPHVHQVIPLAPAGGVRSLVRRLRGEGFGAILDLHDSPRSRTLRALLPRVPTVVWTKRAPGSGPAVKLALRPFHAEMWLADRFHGAVEELVGTSLPRGVLRTWLGPGLVEQSRARLTDEGVDLATPIVGMAPGAKWSTKRWPVERFGELARSVLATGRQVVVSGSPDERALCQELAAQAPGTYLVDADLTLWSGIISLCEAFVANDSGPMHIARSLQVPTLALFGSTDPRQFDFTGHAALSAPPPCAPCHFYGRSFCPRLHFRCMRELHVEPAWVQLSRLLEGDARPTVHG